MGCMDACQSVQPLNNMPVYSPPSTLFYLCPLFYSMYSFVQCHTYHEIVFCAAYLRRFDVLPAIRVSVFY